ncbi:hypothetical protein [Comamonas sp. JC664]|uniref:hypothetical protein n=1 Tax=Comamonas sp. JC664 TaxID=2801917 RepID=UPI001748EC8E|nr:hypothetical protein [Comamonas sp. JC664]MBL0698874.1 hypothetical protein [Comamonas sp. JC664]GHG79324.1 hypothetical protein GCM10012319_31060 [Comamonas sp. KCTC 72670]
MSTALQTRAPSHLAPGRFGQTRYMIRRKFFKLFGDAFHIYDEAGNLAFYSKLKAFKLKEDIRIYTDEEMREELIIIKARGIIDFGMTYDVTDAVTGERLGALRRKGLRSLFRDQWLVLDANDQEVGKIEEDSMAMALVRRFLSNLIPQSFTGTLGLTQVFAFHQRFNPFIQKIDLDFSMDLDRQLDRRLGIAAAVLMCAIEGRQQ